MVIGFICALITGNKSSAWSFCARVDQINVYEFSYFTEMIWDIQNYAAPGQPEF